MAIARTNWPFDSRLVGSLADMLVSAGVLWGCEVSDEPIRPFEVIAPPKPGLFDRLRGRISRDAAFTEIRNLLATTSFDQVRESDVTDILVKAKVLCREVSTELQLIFEHAALILSSDGDLNAQDRLGLLTLQRAFELTEEEAARAREAAIGQVFERTMRETLSDGKFTKDEKLRLEATAQSLGMDTTQTKRLYDAAAVAAIGSALASAIADRRYTATEEAQVSALAKALDVQLAQDEKTKAVIVRFKLLAQIDAGNLPTLAVPVLLKRNEECHFAGRAGHHQIKTVTKRINYGGVSASFKIMKGVRYRTGSMAVQRVTSDVMTQLDTGNLYITSSRLLFDGEKKNTAIPFGKVTTFTVYKDGLKIEKDTGSDQYFIGSGDWELAGACLDVAMGKLR